VSKKDYKYVDTTTAPILFPVITDLIPHDLSGLIRNGFGQDFCRIKWIAHSGHRTGIRQSRRHVLAQMVFGSSF